MTEAYEYPVVHLALRTGNLARAWAFYAELLGWGGAAGAARRAGGLAERRRLAGGRRDRPLAAEVASHRP
jgi:predicted enzyme related to lactoylglutathione lyase